MSKTIDAKGQNCPIPVIMAKKEIEAGGQSFIVEVDNTTAVRNLEKLASTRGFASSVEGKASTASLFPKTAKPSARPCRRTRVRTGWSLSGVIPSAAAAASWAPT